MANLIRALKQRQSAVRDLSRRGQFGHGVFRHAAGWARSLPGSSGVFALASKADESPKVNDATMSARFVISSMSKDRHGDVVVPKGCIETLATYVRNPVVFLNHDSLRLPIGMARGADGNVALKVVDSAITSECFWHGKTLESAQSYELVKLGVLRGASIGFRPRRGKRVKPSEGYDDDSRPRDEVNFEGWYYSFIFELWELVEWSVVGVPANPDALVLDSIRSVTSKGVLAGKPLSERLRQALSPHAFIRPRYLTGGATLMSKTTYAQVVKADAPGAGGEGGTGTEEAQKSVQALLVPKDKKATVEEAAEHALGLDESLDTSDVEETDTHWAFIQFEPTECGDGTVEKKELEDGCIVVLCAKGAAAKEDEPSRVAQPAEADEGGEGDEKGAKSADCQGGCACKGKQNKDLASEPAKTDAGDADDKGEDKPVLPGVALINALKQVLDTLAPLQENAAVKKGCEKTSALWAKIAASEYPEEDFGWKAEAADGDEGEEEEEGDHDEPDGDEPEGKGTGRLVIKLSKKTTGIIREAADWLSEHAGEDNLTKSQRAAAKHHFRELDGVASSADKPEEGEAAEGKSADRSGKTDENEAIQKASATLLESLSASVERLGKRLYSLTGR